MVEREGLLDFTYLTVGRPPYQVQSVEGWAPTGRDQAGSRRHLTGGWYLLDPVPDTGALAPYAVDLVGELALDRGGEGSQEALAGGWYLAGHRWGGPQAGSAQAI